LFSGTCTTPVSTTIATSNTNPAITHGRGPGFSNTATPASSGAPRNVTMNTGLTIATLIPRIPTTNVRSSPRARPGSTEQA
jgi:hypothetical protein